MRITQEWLADHGACVSGFNAFCKYERRLKMRGVPLMTLMRALIRKQAYNWACWIKSELLDELSRRQFRAYARDLAKLEARHYMGTISPNDDYMERARALDYAYDKMLLDRRRKKRRRAA